MKQVISFSFLLLTTLSTLAQGLPESIKPLLDAEEAFAKMAKEHNTRDAFIYFFSDSVVTAAPGAGPSLGKHHLEQQSPNESWLNWWPSMSHIASSRDFGVNSGPWEFRRDRNEPEPIAWGQFLSVWKKEANGDWKVALDMGISHSKPSRNLALRSPQLHGTDSRRDKDLFYIEQQLIRSLNDHNPNAYNDWLSAEARFLRTGLEPLSTRSEIIEHVKASAPGVYTFADGDIASSKDLAYTYGSARFVDASTPSGYHVRSYARIWKKESDGWRILVDLLSD